MKHALILGGGSKWGASFTKNLADNGYTIDLITSSNFEYPNVINHKIDWISSDQHIIIGLLEPLKNKIYDLIFFNQNSGGGPNEQSFAPGGIFPIDHWHMHNWINCHLPYVVVKTMSNSIQGSTKVGWMITGLVDGTNKDLWKYAGYASVKSTNIHIMQGFANQHHGIFFAMDPIWFPEDDYKKDAETILSKIEGLTKEDSGSIIKKQA